MRWAEEEDRNCRIVFIGKRLDRAFLEEGFNATTRYDHAWCGLAVELLPSCEWRCGVHPSDARQTEVLL